MLRASLVRAALGATDSALEEFHVTSRHHLAGIALRRVEGHLHDAAPVDADRGQGAACTDAVAQSLLARHALRDRAHAAYDADYANRHFRVLAATHRVFSHFRTGFLGKVSPVHFFWGSFDLAVTRFSGRPAPPLTSHTPGLPDAVAREAYSHEVSSAGFWAGGGPIDYAAYYSYAYPEPENFSEAKVRPAQAFYFKDFGQFILPYDAVRT